MFKLKKMLKSDYKKKLVIEVRALKAIENRLWNGLSKYKLSPSPVVYATYIKRR